MNKEVELTAKLEKAQFESLRKKFIQKYKKAPKQKRFMIRFFKEKVNVREPLDIRYKWTSGVDELVIKKGALGSTSRKELIIPLGNKQTLEEFVQFFRFLGFKEAVAVYREVEKFRGGGVEASLITAGDYYSIEVEAEDGRSRKNALEKVNGFYKSISLKPLAKPDYQTYLRKLDREVNFIFPMSEFPKALINNSYWKKILRETVFSKRKVI